MNDNSIKALPPDEVEYLRNLHPPLLYARVQELHRVGWDMDAVARAFDPPMRVTTVRSWLLRRSSDPRFFTIPDYLYVSPPLPEDSTYYLPGHTPPPAPGAPKPPYRPKNVRGTPVPEPDAERMLELIPMARKYRGNMDPAHPVTRANNEYNALLRRLHFEDGIPIQQLAEVAGVTYKAIAKRVKPDEYK